MSDPRFPFELSVWLTSSFPIGSFAFSHGLEWAAAEERISDRATAAGWIEDLVRHGGPRNDCILLANAYGAAGEAALERLVEVNELALALTGSKERFLETTAQGNAFMSTMLAAWSMPALVRARGSIDGDIAFPVALAIATQAYSVPVAAALRAYLSSFVVNMTSALVRLAVVGQTDAQRIIAGLMPLIEHTAAEAECGDLERIRSAAFIGDIAAIAHETQDTRLFRT